MIKRSFNCTLSYILKVEICYNVLKCEIEDKHESA